MSLINMNELVSIIDQRIRVVLAETFANLRVEPVSSGYTNGTAAPAPVVYEPAPETPNAALRKRSQDRQRRKGPREDRFVQRGQLLTKMPKGSERSLKTSQHLLEVIEANGGEMKSTQFLAATGLTFGMFHFAKDKLVEQGVLKTEGEKAHMVYRLDGRKLNAWRRQNGEPGAASEPASEPGDAAVTQ